MASPSNLMMLALASLVESKTNPRKHVDDKYLDELAASIKASGVLQPIIARPLNGSGKYEVVVGSRRVKATKKAGLDTIPAIVRKLTDAEAMEVQIIENLQRQDVHPMEEGNGYKALLALRDDKKQPLYTMDSIALKVGKSPSYVYQRLKLAELTEPWQAEFLEHADRFTAGHAILVARLTPEYQAALKKEYWIPDYDKSYPSVRDLREIIDERVVRELNKAPFKTDGVYETKDAKVHPDAKPTALPAVKLGEAPKNFALPVCGGCRFNSANMRDATDPKKPLCMNATCYETKVTVDLNRKQETLRKESPDAVMISRSYTLEADAKKHLPAEKVVTANQYEEVKSTARGAVKALVVDGRDRGQVTYIVPSKAVEREADKRRQPTAQERQEALERDYKHTLPIYQLKALAEAVKLDDAFLLDVAAFAVDEGFDSNLRKKFFGDVFEGTYGAESFRKKLASKKRPELLAIIATGLFAKHVGFSFSSGVPAGMKDAIARYKVDSKAVEKAARAEFAKRQQSIDDQRKREKQVASAKKAEASAKALRDKARAITPKQRDGKVAAGTHVAARIAAEAAKKSKTAKAVAKGGKKKSQAA